MEIIQERLRREYNMDIIATYPSVIYHVYLNNGTMVNVDNPVHLPDPSEINRIEEPLINAKIMAPTTYMGDIMNLIMQKRGICTNTESVDGRHILLTARIPMHEILIDFHDKLKSITRGYGSMDYEPAGYQADKLVKLDMLVNGEPVDAFSTIVHADHAYNRGRMLAEKLAAGKASAEELKAAASEISDQFTYGSNMRGSAEYRHHLGRVLLRRCMEEIQKKEEQ